MAEQKETMSVREKQPSHEQETPRQRVIVVMGSESDYEHFLEIKEVLDRFEVENIGRVGSAHKTPEHVLDIVHEYNKEKGYQTIFIAVAGRSNALGGFIDANSVSPVIQSPPLENGWEQDIFSSLRMPSNLAAPTALEPRLAALHAIKILALNNSVLRQKYYQFQLDIRQLIINADHRLQEKEE